MNKQHIFSAALAVASFFQAQNALPAEADAPATRFDISGTVVDKASAEPLIGATIILKDDKSVGIVTDVDGHFNLSVNHTSPLTIEVGYVGYETVELSLTEADAKALNIALSELSQAVAEVVVVGYGTQKRTQLTGSVAKVSAETFSVATAPTLDVALSGAVAGLNITASSGQPGAASNVRIRGGNSVNASNEPLYVVDGFIYYKDASAAKTGLGAIETSLNPLSTINPADIESVEVLKDVSATAIYGSRGANGVIIVTTKKGQRGKATVNYRYSAGFDSAVRTLDLMDAREWAAFQKTYYNNKGGYSDADIAALGHGTDWQAAMLRTALRQSHELSISGGSEAGRYAFSANYADQDGIVLNSGFRRYNFHVNADYDVRPYLTFGLLATFGKSTQNGLTTTEQTQYNSSPYSAGITNSFVYGLLLPPVVPVYAADGSYNFANPYEYAYFAIGGKATNAVADLEESEAESINSYLLSNVWAQATFADFRLKAALGLNRESVTQNYFSPSFTSLGLAVDGIGGIGNKRSEVWQQEYTLFWGRQLSDAHYLDALAGFTRQTSAADHNSVIASHFTNETLKHNNLADGADVYPPDSGSSRASLNSWIARANYTLRDRYNATATFRADRSSRFAKSHRWGLFPSLGLSWNVDKEDFLSGSGVVSGLKVRASWGVVGNQEIGDYEYSVSYKAARYDGSSSYAKASDVNDNLKWETTTSANVGFDLGLWGGRVNVVADAYFKKTADLLLTVPTGFAQGVSTQLQNVGNVVNKGLELSADVTIFSSDRLTWTVSANIAHNANEITDMGATADVIQGAQSETILRKGESLGSFYGLIFTGIVQATDDVAALPTVNGSTPQPGDAMFADVNADGKIDGKDRVVLGSRQPDFTYGVSSSLRLKGLDVSLSLAGSHGGKLFNALGRRLEQTSDSYNLLASVLDSWTPTNPSNRYPLASNSRPFSYVDSRYVEGASFLKLRNVTIGYALPLPSQSPVSARVFATGANLFTISHYSGYDPEVASGTDTGAYPASRSLVFGIGLTL